MAFKVMLMVILLAGAVAAQSPSTAQPSPGIEVLSSTWHTVRYSPALDQDPLAIIDRQVNLQRAITDTLTANKDRVKANQPVLPIPTGASAPTAPYYGPRASSSAFSYEIRIRNTGTKTIRRLVWDYDLSNPTEKNLRSRRFEVKTTIRPGHSKNLRANGGPPRVVVNVKPAGTVNPSDQVIIERVEYLDGSFWARPPK